MSNIERSTEHNLINRRAMLGRSTAGVGSVALASLLAGDSAQAAAATGGLKELPHFAPKVKRVIYLLMSGAPSQVDLLDYKPDLEQQRGKELPESVHMGQRLTTMTAGQKAKPVLPTRSPFRQHGQSGMWISDLLPHTGSIADEICLIKSMHTESINHAPAVTKLFTGAEQPGRPSMGAWLAYGLGNETQELPTFCVMTSRDREGTCGQLFYDYYWGSGFLPTKFQGVKFRDKGSPVLYLDNPEGISRELRRGQLDDLAELNRLKLGQVGDPEINTRIAQYEMAFRMQASVPALADISSEPKHVLDLYGEDVQRPGSFARNCLLARRLSEQGVRFVQLLHSGWDQHQNLPTQLAEQCKDTDQPAAALVKDLKQRGMLDETLVVWGGEFGRTVFCQGDMNNAKKHGRDHHPRNFCLWMAGGGLKRGITFGESDDFSYNVASDPVHVHDLQATILHLLGVDHERLTFKFQGRHYRLTDVHGKIVRGVLV
mgnify:CR=1 FL=1